MKTHLRLITTGLLAPLAMLQAGERLGMISSRLPRRFTMSIMNEMKK